MVLVVDTYHHLPNRPAYFRDLRKSLKPGGRVAIIDFRKDAPEGPPVHFRFTPQQIEDEMTQAGYQLDGVARLPAAPAFPDLPVTVPDSPCRRGDFLDLTPSRPEDDVGTCRFG